MTSFVITSKDDARVALMTSLGLELIHGRSSAFTFELLRALLWTMTSGATPVHVQRILNRGVAIAVTFAPDIETDRVRQELRKNLDLLADAGDAVELDGGFWLSARTRYVRLGSDRGGLLVGGIPTRVLPARCSALSHHGAFRRLRPESELPGLLSLPEEPLALWARWPTEPLREWAMWILGQPLAPYYLQREAAEFVLYAPEQARSDAPQFKRWTDSFDGQQGPRLARRSRRFGGREYHLVHLEGGKVVRSGAVLGRGEARRLMYALDSLAGRPVTVQWRSTTTTAELVTRSELPASEKRLFSAFGEVQAHPDRAYEQRWLFHSHIELVAERLRSLELVL